MGRISIASTMLFCVLTQPCSSAAGEQAHKHEHGTASLQVAVDGASLNVVFASPLDNLLGFERAPRNDTEREALRVWSERLRRPDALFVPSAAASCSLQSNRVDAPLLAAASPSQGGAVAPKGAESGQRPASAKASGHAHLEASFELRCRHPELLRGLEAAIFEHAPRLRRIDVQLVAPQRQSAAQLTPARRKLAW